MTNSELVSLVFIVTIAALGLLWIGNCLLTWATRPVEDFTDECAGSGGYPTEQQDADARARRAGL